jgi:hypothetical protein
VSLFSSRRPLPASHPIHCHATPPDPLLDFTHPRHHRRVGSSSVSGLGVQAGFGPVCDSGLASVPDQSKLRLSSAVDMTQG